MNTVLAEISYSAILWGSLIVALLWYVRSRIRHEFSRVLLWIPLGWFGLHTVIAWYAFFIPPGGRLIDAATGVPIGNRRVVTTWISYPIPIIGISTCTGRQAHLTKEDGTFAFRFAPYATLFSGTYRRFVNPMVPGHYDESWDGYWLTPPRGDMRARRYFVGRQNVPMPIGKWCEFSSTPQYEYGAPYVSKQRPAGIVGLLPGEEPPFDATYREACIEKRDWTLNYIYMKAMLDEARYSGPRLELGGGLPIAPPASMQYEMDQIAIGCDAHNGTCTKAIVPEVRESFCGYMAEVRAFNQAHRTPMLQSEPVPES